MRFLFVLLMGWSLSAEAWTKHALRLTGESDKVREDALVALKKTPKLEQTLRAALQTEDKYLALDVISAMNLQKLLPDVVDLSQKDENGSLYLTINTLLNPSNQARIVKVYLERLKHPGEVSMPAQVVLLDTLGRMGVSIPDSTLEAYLESPSYETRSAALYYLRFQLLKFGGEARLPHVENFLSQDPYQIRLQAIHLILDLPPKLKTAALPFLSKCHDDRNEEVKVACRNTARGKR